MIEPNGGAVALFEVQKLPAVLTTSTFVMALVLRRTRPDVRQVTHRALEDAATAQRTVGSCS